MIITEELSNLEKEQAQDREILTNVQNYIITNLEEYERGGKTPQLIYDSLIEKVARYHNIPPRRAIKIIDKAVTTNDNLRNDGTTIHFKYYIVKCKCGARYSTKLEKCPNCSD